MNCICLKLGEERTFLLKIKKLQLLICSFLKYYFFLRNFQHTHFAGIKFTLRIFQCNFKGFNFLRR